MIDYAAERLQQLRNARTFAWMMAVACALSLAAPQLVEDALIVLFCAFFILRYLEYATRIHALELDAEDLRPRDRRSRMP
jgi:hypothetical protein